MSTVQSQPLINLEYSRCSRVVPKPVSSQRTMNGQKASAMRLLVINCEFSTNCPLHPHPPLSHRPVGTTKNHILHSK